MPSVAKGVVKIIYYSYRYRDTKFNSEHNFSGTQLIISSSQEEYKIFDFKSRLLLTKYTSLEKLIKYNDNKAIFAHSFNVAKTINIDKKESAIVEQLIQHNTIDVTASFKTLVRSINNHLIFVKPTLNNNQVSYAEMCDFFASRFGNSNILKDKSGQTCIMSHGDLWSSNVISNGNVIFITDFERAGNRFFLYDFFTFIFTEWLLNNDSTLLHKYFIGEFDSALEQIFHSVDKIYSNTNREKYLLAFLIYYTYERWKNSSTNDERVANFMKLYTPSYFNRKYEKNNHSNIGC